MLKIKEKIKFKKQEEDIPIPLIIPTLPNSVEYQSNLFLFQKIFKIPFEVYIK